MDFIPELKGVLTSPIEAQDAVSSRTAQPFSTWPELLSIEDIIGCLGISRRHATDILKDRRLSRPFPIDRRNMFVGKYALRDFLNGRIIQEGEE